jgi:hypothetical protein
MRTLTLKKKNALHKVSCFLAIAAALCLGMALILSLAGCGSTTGGGKEEPPDDKLNLGGTLTFSGINPADTPPALTVYSNAARTAKIADVSLALGGSGPYYYTWTISIDNSYAGTDLYFSVVTAEPRTIKFVYTADGDDNESGIALSIITVSFTADGSNINILVPAEMPKIQYSLRGYDISLPLSYWRNPNWGGRLDPVFTRTGSTFRGWKNEAAGGDVYDEDALYTLTESADFSMNAQWFDFILENADAAYNGNPLGKKIVASAPNSIPQDFTIPSKSEGVDITEIAEGAFYGQDIIKLTIPETVQFIYQQAFAGISGLTEVTMGPFTDISSGVEANAFPDGLASSAVLDRTKRLTYKKVNGVWYGRGGGFYIFAFEAPGEVEFTLPPDTAYLSGTETLTVTIDTTGGVYDSYEWWINGTRKTGAGWTGASATFTRSDFSQIGECPITVIAGKNGVYYSAKFELVIGD